MDDTERERIRLLVSLDWEASEDESPPPAPPRLCDELAGYLPPSD